MALPQLQQPLQMQQGGQGLDSTETILSRRKEHENDEWREIAYGLRMTVAGVLDRSTTGYSNTTIHKDGKFADAIKSRWEEGQHNAIRVNTHLQAKSLVFNEPDIKWRNTKVADPSEDDLVSKVRAAYYLKLWRTHRMQDMYRNGLLDMITSGERNIAFWKLPTGLAPEYLDSLNVTWDPVYKEPHRRRYVYVDRPMPKGDAIAQFPALEKMVSGGGSAGAESTVTVTCYYSQSTYAVLYKKQFVLGPMPNPYGRIPIRCTELFRELSVKHPTGMAELQIGTHKEQLRLQRYFRETVLKAIPVGVFKGGGWKKEQMDKVRDAEEGECIHTQTPSDSFEYAKGAEIQASAMERYQMLEQQMNAESGVNDFQRGQTDTKVDFASQLAYIAQQSGVLGRYCAQQHEDGIREDAAMIMEIAAVMEEGPISLVIDDHEINFDQLTPINLLLGGDGDIILTPGGMEYKSPAQRVQETMVVTEALMQAAQLPPGLKEPLVRQTLKAFDFDNAEEIVNSMIQAEQQQMMMAQQQALMAQGPQGGPQGGPPAPGGGQPPPATLPGGSHQGR